MFLAKDWKDYEIIDCSNGEKFERWGNIKLLRPDPQIIWNNGNLKNKYDDINAFYVRSNKGGGHWENLRKTPERWTVAYKDLKFNIKQMGFKHTGLFPEQAVNWNFMMDKISRSKRDIKVLNLFAYTGGATVACLKAGASVVHVDSSRGMVDWAKENVVLSDLEDRPVRYIVDDVVKFVKREIRRGNKYDAIIMDPPSYGRGPKGEIWKIEECVYPLIQLTTQILSDKPLFFLVNSYTTGLQPAVLTYMISTALKNFDGKVESSEIGLPVTSNGLVLPCGASGRFQGNL